MIYISKPIFKDYILSGSEVCRQLVAQCIDRLVSNQLFKSNLPTTAEISLRRQADTTIVHILNYISQRKCKGLDIIEAPTPLYNIELYVKVINPPHQCFAVPEMNALNFSYSDGYITIQLPYMLGHQMIVIA